MSSLYVANPGDRTAGLCLIISAGLTVFAMGHHPSSHSAGTLSAIVHGGMIVLLIATFYGLIRFAISRGLDKPVILAGLTAYGISVVAHVIAATLNGFIAPVVANPSAGAGLGHDFAVFCWETNQAFAKLGVCATGAAFFLWSCDFVRRPAMINKIIAVVGFAAGLGPIVSVASGNGLTVSTAFASYTSHAVWLILVGARMTKGHVVSDETSSTSSDDRVAEVS